MSFIVAKKAAKVAYRVGKAGYRVAKSKKTRCAVKAARAKKGKRSKVFRACMRK